MKTYNVTYQVYFTPSGVTPWPVTTVKVFANNPTEAYSKAKAMALYGMPTPIGQNMAYQTNFKQISAVEFNACSTLGNSNKNSTY